MQAIPSEMGWIPMLRQIRHAEVETRPLSGPRSITEPSGPPRDISTNRSPHQNDYSSTRPTRTSAQLITTVDDHALTPPGGR